MKNKKPKIKKVPKYPNGGTTDEFNSVYNQTFNTNSSTVSAINPLYGAVTKGMGMIAKPIKDELDKTETGRKINYGMGWAFSPLEMAVTSNKTGIWSPNEYNQQYVDQEQSVKANSLLPASGKFKHGGITNSANAELEKQEVFKTPDGQINSVNGPSHENGGIPVNIPNQTKILSDKLKLNGKTFAELGAKYKTNKEDKILNDDKANSAAKATAKLTAEIKQRKLDELFNTQEQMKQAKLAKYANKLGVTLPTEQFRNGGIKKYDDGGTAQEIYDRDKQRIIDENEPMVTLPMRKSYLDESINYNETSDYDPSYDKASMIGEYSETNPEFWGPGNPETKRNYSSAIEPVINTLVQNAGNIAYLAQQGKKYDKVDYGKVIPKLPSYKEALRQANQESAMARNNIKNITGGSGGAAMSNFVANQTANTLNKARIIEQGENAIAGVSNNMAQFNKANEIQGMSDEAANKGQALSNYYKAIEGIGRNTSAAYTDYKKGQMDINTAKMLNSAFANYGLDINNPYHWNIFYKKTQDDQKLGATSNLTSTTPGVPSNVNSYSGMNHLN